MRRLRYCALLFSLGMTPCEFLAQGKVIATATT